MYILLVRSFRSLLDFHTHNTTLENIFLGYLIISLIRSQWRDGGFISAPPSSESTTFLTCSHILASLVMVILINCCLSLTSFYSCCRAVNISLDLLYKSPIIETDGYISVSPRCKIGAAGYDSIIFSNYLATLEIPLYYSNNQQNGSLP